MNALDLIKQFGGTDSVQDYAGFSLQGTLFPHKRFAKAIRCIAEVHHYAQKNATSRGLMLTGPTGAGKTTILNFYEGKFPRYSDGTATCIPVLKVSTPVAPTLKSLAQTLLIALQDRFDDRGSGEAKTKRVYQFLEKCKVQLIFIDEFHHCLFAKNGEQYSAISEWLKLIMNELNIALVLVGLPEGERIVYNNHQLRRRFSSRIQITPFSISEECDFDEFRGILRAYQGQLPLKVEVPLHEANLARRFLIGSDGRLDYVRKILEGAVAVAQSIGCATLDLPIYESAYRNEVWDCAPDELNPFSTQSILRRLDKKDEPFDVGGYGSMIGSPVARHLGLALRTQGRAIG